MIVFILEKERRMIDNKSQEIDDVLRNNIKIVIEKVFNSKDYFDVEKFSQDNNLIFNDRHKLIIPSQIPQDNRYVEFINSLKIGVALIGNDRLNPVGKDLGFSLI